MKRHFFLEHLTPNPLHCTQSNPLYSVNDVKHKFFNSEIMFYDQAD